MIPLAAFRGTTRPVIIAGSRSQLSRALAGSEPFQAALRERGVSVVPLELSAEDAGEKLRQLKAEFAGSSGGSSSSKGFGGGAAAPAAAQPAPTAGLTTKVGAAGGGVTALVGCWVRCTWFTHEQDRSGMAAARLHCMHLAQVMRLLRPTPPCLPAPPPCAQDRKWQLKAHDEAEWQQWVQALKAAKGITADAVYVQVGGC